ncbi:hypothetical protein ES702_03889 [subsurface metagenome]
MSSKLRKIYAVMPVSVQNLMMSVRGWSFNRRRYRKEYPQYFDNLMRSQWFSGEQFRDLQTAELRKLIKEAAQNVPYYRKTLGKFLNKLDSFTLDNLKDIPIVDKSVFRANIEEFTNPERLKFGCDKSESSGTTGVPLVMQYDFDSTQHSFAFRERQYRWAGITGKEKSARFSSRVIMGRHNQAPYWRYNAAEKQWLFSTYHINEKTIPQYYEALKRFNCAYLDGYPSSIFEIAKWVNRAGKSRQWRLWAVITTAETLLDFHREEIERAFGCPIYNFYSSSEGAPWITQCAAGNMHINPESGIVEFLRPDGKYAQPGQEAEMVITGFFQRTAPLIRYRIADTAVLAENQSCPCGREMPVIEYIGGRQAECLHSTERGWVSGAAVSGVLLAVNERLNGSQIEQVDTDSFILRYIPNGTPLNQQETSIVLERFYKRLGRSIDIKFEVVDEIPRGPAGKSRQFIGLPAEKLKSLKND